MKNTLLEIFKKSPLEFVYRNLKRRQLHKNAPPICQSSAKFYAQFARGGDLVFDIGANYGNRTRVFRHLGARTIAFEPQATCFEYLKSFFWGDTGVLIENVALGKSTGKAKMLISKNSVLSTLSTDYIEKNVASGRFGPENWTSEQEVEVSTLDLCIQKYGVPRFVKIDVEGFESEVIRGLSKPIEFLSLEFSTETRATVIEAVEHLATISNYRFQFSREESFEFSSEQWMDLLSIKKILLSFEGLEWGDVYCKKY